MNYYGYILQSETTGAYYTGQTDDIEERLKNHNRGEERSTKSGCPWRLVFRKEFATRSEAVRWERYVKSRKRRAYIEKLIQSYSSERGAVPFRLFERNENPRPEHRSGRDPVAHR